MAGASQSGKRGEREEARRDADGRENLSREGRRDLARPVQRVMFDLVTIGHTARDEFEGEPEWRIGGTATYAAAAAACLGDRVALLTRVGPNERERLAARCRELGIELHALESAVTTTFSFRYVDGRRHLRLKARAKGIGAEAIPPPLRETSAVVPVSAKLEAEIAELPPEEAASFRKELGLAEPALDRLIRATYELLGLCSFFTVGEDEVRAWTVPRGAPAQQAAGAIHTDLERGFIRAEVIGWQELLKAGSEANAKKLGVMRTEGKTYPVKDGEILHVLFNV
ncbi:MAG: DUF933 domain-containing protein [Chloroflexi bacterium]|nr:MAG: DUF933 domain-containing protein [Chloroflexota bacterium]